MDAKPCKLSTNSDIRNRKSHGQIATIGKKASRCGLKPKNLPFRWLYLHARFQNVFASPYLCKDAWGLMNPICDRLKFVAWMFVWKLSSGLLTRHDQVAAKQGELV